MRRRSNSPIASRQLSLPSCPAGGAGAGRRFDEALRPLGLTQGQFSLLMSLNRPRAAEHWQRLDPARHGPHDATANLKPLERRGLVKVAVDKADRRGRRLSLTAKGKSLLAAAAPIWERTHAETEHLLTQQGPDALRESLRALC